MNIPDNIRVNASFPFPALVQGSGPITLTKINGIWTIGYNGSALGVINTAPPLTGGPIDLSGGGGAIGLAPSGVVAGSYTNTNLTVNAQGLLTAASSGTGGGGSGAGTVSFTSFGAVGDGATDNSGAWNAFNTFARAESTAGRGVNLVIPPGTFNYDGGAGNNFFIGIKKLHVIGYGAIIQNTYDRNIHGANSAFEWAISPPCQVNLFTSTAGIGPLIQSTAIGDNHVTLLSTTFIGQFSVGQWVMVGSLDIQYYGGPPNLDLFDYVQIATINTGAGVITFKTSLNNAHRSDFADGGNPNPCGKARIYSLDYAPAGSIWDIDHLYEGIEIRQAPNTDLAYMNMSGRSYKIRNCTWVGISPTVSSYVEAVGCRIIGLSEPDKIVQNLLIDGCWFDSRLTFQSGSIDCVTIRNCRIDVDLECGQVKQMLVQNCKIASFSEGSAGAQFGTARGLVLDSCVISQASGGIFPPSGGTPIPIDGTNVIYANGVFKVVKVQAYASQFGVTLGSMVNLTSAGGAFSGNIGTGIVTKISEDATYILIQTTLPYATLPSWATGGVWLNRHTNFSVINCSGCDPIINYNKLTAQGLNIWGNFDLLLTGWGTEPAGRGTFGFLTDVVGNLTSVTVNVIQAYPSGGRGILQFTWSAMDATTMTGSTNYEIDIDLSVVGKRVFTQSALTGKVGADQVLYNSVAQTTLKSGIWLIGGGEWTYFLDTGNLTPVPIVEFTLVTDTGIIRTLVPAIDMSA